MDLDGVKGIIFDMGSTLIEFENRSWEEIGLEGQRRAYDSIISEQPLPDFDRFNTMMENIKDEFRANARATLEEWVITEAPRKLFTELSLPDIDKQVERFSDQFYSVVREGLTVCDSAVDTLREVKERGYRTGLISNTIFLRDDHERDLEQFGIIDYLDFRIYSSEFGRRKPHPDIFREGLDRIGLGADETIYVGDRYYEDVEGPRQVGMQGVLKYHEGRNYPDPLPNGFPIIQKLSELLQIIR